MAEDLNKLITDRLRSFQGTSPNIEASAVISIDGLSIASLLPSSVEDDIVSAMSAAMVSLGSRIAMELARGNIEQVYVRGQNGYVILMAIGEEAVFTVLAGQGAKLGLIFLDMKRTGEEIKKLLSL
jgi:predicted regulator of Ras-like GTPase activity (Roadblock/LC7/MglB family)